MGTVGMCANGTDCGYCDRCKALRILLTRLLDRDGRASCKSGGREALHRRRAAGVRGLGYR